MVFKMANLSIREAVKHFDVSRPTLTKALKTGKIAGQRDEKGHWSIDPSELSRVYRSRDASYGTGVKSLPEGFSPDVQSLHAEIERLNAAVSVAEARANAAEQIAEERAARIDDLRRLLPSPGDTKSVWRWPWQR